MASPSPRSSPWATRSRPRAGSGARPWPPSPRSTGSTARRWGGEGRAVRLNGRTTTPGDLWPATGTAGAPDGTTEGTSRVTISYEQATAAVTAPGQRFETDRVEIGGRGVTVFRHAPPTLPEVFATARTRGDRDFLVYEDERWSFD